MLSRAQRILLVLPHLILVQWHWLRLRILLVGWTEREHSHLTIILFLILAILLEVEGAGMLTTRPLNMLIRSINGPRKLLVLSQFRVFFDLLDLLLNLLLLLFNLPLVLNILIVLLV